MALSQAILNLLKLASKVPPGGLPLRDIKEGGADDDGSTSSLFVVWGPLKLIEVNFLKNRSFSIGFNNSLLLVCRQIWSSRSEYLENRRRKPTLKREVERVEEFICLSPHNPLTQRNVSSARHLKKKESLHCQL